jgi:hypothetical protein
MCHVWEVGPEQVLWLAGAGALREWVAWESTPRGRQGNRVPGRGAVGANTHLHNGGEACQVGLDRILPTALWGLANSLAALQECIETWVQDRRWV